MASWLVMSTQEVRLSISAIHANEIYTSIMIEGIQRNIRIRSPIYGRILHVWFQGRSDVIWMASFSTFRLKWAAMFYYIKHNPQGFDM